MEQTPLKTGDILIDHGAREIGVLVRRYNIFEEDVNLVLVMEEIDYDAGVVWVWDIFWVGPGPWPLDRLQTYTEEGLLLLIETCVLSAPG
mgnify:FL=1|jgi:hypothetical protein